MKPRRVACKFFVDPPTAEVDLAPVTSMFHGFIQRAALDGLLIDVADYAHVPRGPGVVLIGHELDYGIDLVGGRAGLLTTRKRYGELPVASAVQGLLAAALRAVDAIESDGRSGLRFATGSVTIRLVDRLAAPNQADAYEAAAGALAPLFDALYGEKYEVTREDPDDPRRPLGLSVTAQQSGPAAELAGRVEALALSPSLG